MNIDADQPWWVYPAIVQAWNDAADDAADAQQREELGLPDLSQARDVSSNPNAIFQGM